MNIMIGIVGFLLTVLVGVPLFALPATISLGWRTRPGLPHRTIAQEADQLRESGETGWTLVEAVRALVEGRMAYCRRNSFDAAPRAFARGYGYCQQQAHALAGILNRLGFTTKVVGAFRNKFPDGVIGGHAWVQVTYAGETRDIDSLFYDQGAGEITFTPLSRVFDYTPAFRFFAGWGSSAVNAYRYYRTGKDR
jgi:hypothetical protein